MSIDPQLDLFQAKMPNRLLLFPEMKGKIRLALGGTTCTVWQQEGPGLDYYSCLHVLPCLLGSFTVPLSLKLRATIGASVSVYSCIDSYRFLFTTFISSKLTGHLQLFPLCHAHARTHAAPSIALMSRFRRSLPPLLCRISGALRWIINDPAQLLNGL